MTEQPQTREAQGGGTWGPREAAAEWRRGAAARVQAFGPATDMMLDLVKVAVGSRVLDVGAGAGDSTLVAAQRVAPSGRVLATDIYASMPEIAAESARRAGLNNVDTGRGCSASRPRDRFVRRDRLTELPHAHSQLPTGLDRDSAGTEAGRPIRGDRVFDP